MTREEIIAAHPLKLTAERYGVEFKFRTGGEWYARCPFHEDKKPSFRVNEEKETWFCDPCNVGGSVIDFVMRKESIDIATCMTKLGGKPDSNWRGQEEVTYDYTDENGTFLYQVVRYIPKDFRQRHRNLSGEWVYDIKGIRRVLYRLHEIHKQSKVIVVEGEKDACSLWNIGLPATCNSGGAGKWLPSFAESLRDKIVVVIPDNDTPGEKHAKEVLESLTGVAKSVFRLNIPPPDKDATDFIKRHGDNAVGKLREMLKEATQIQPVVNLPIKSMADLEVDYRTNVTASHDKALKLGKWLPMLGSIRPIIPGELVAVLADTGVGKTVILQHIALYAQPLKTLIFSIELPGPLIFERFVQLERGIPGDEVYSTYVKGGRIEWDSMGTLSHLYVCSESKMNPAEMERIINGAEVKIGERPALVLVDYVGLMNGRGSSRYERISDVAEQMKVIAKSTNTVIVMASQIHRPPKDGGDGEIFLHDAKDSGSIENSAGLVLGAWRGGKDGEILNIKVLKNTKGKAGKIIECDFIGERMEIRQRKIINGVTRIDPSDLPAPWSTPYRAPSPDA